VLHKTITPLFDERLPVDDHERRNGSPGDERTGDYRLPRTRRSHEYSDIMREERLERPDLSFVELCPKGYLYPPRCFTRVHNVEGAACFLHDAFCVVA
jgi:hypothetical protein